MGRRGFTQALASMVVLWSAPHGANAIEESKPSIEWRAYSEGEVLKSARNLVLPKSLVSHIEQMYIRQFREGHPDAVEKDHEVLAKYERELLPVHVWLSPGSGMSVTEGVRFLLPIGGGEIDFSNYVSSKRGRFGLGMQVDLPEGVSSDQLYIFYISQARVRALDKESFGSGCGKFHDISEFWRSQWRAKEIQLYTKDQRYLSVVAGTYVFVSIKAPQIWLAALTLSDSRFKSLQCLSPSASEG